MTSIHTCDHIYIYKCIALCIITMQSQIPGLKHHTESQWDNSVTNCLFSESMKTEYSSYLPNSSPSTSTHWCMSNCIHYNVIKQQAHSASLPSGWNLDASSTFYCSEEYHCVPYKSWYNVVGEQLSQVTTVVTKSLLRVSSWHHCSLCLVTLPVLV